MRPNSSRPLETSCPGGVMRSMNVASITWCHVSYTAMPIITTPRRPTSQRPAGRSNSVDDTCCGLLVAATGLRRAAAVPVVDRDLRRRHDERPVEHRLDGVLDAVLAVVALDRITDERLDRPPHAHRRQAERQQHEQELAERLVGERGDRALLADLVARRVTTGELDRQDAQDQVQDALGEESGPPEWVAPGARHLLGTRRQTGRGHGSRCTHVGGQRTIGDHVRHARPHHSHRR